MEFCESFSNNDVIAGALEQTVDDFSFDFAYLCSFKTWYFKKDLGYPLFPAKGGGLAYPLIPLLRGGGGLTCPLA